MHSRVYGALTVLLVGQVMFSTQLFPSWVFHSLVKQLFGFDNDSTNTLPNATLNRHFDLNHAPCGDTMKPTASLRPPSHWKGLDTAGAQ